MANLDGIAFKINLAFGRVAKSADFLRRVGEFIRHRIYAITKTGYSMANNPRVPQLLKPLKPRTIDLRREYQAKYHVGPLFSPSRSNLTKTGQMLDSLYYETNQEHQSVTISVKNNSRYDSDLTNREVAEKVSKAGRPFIGLDQAGQKTVINMVKRELRDQLRRLRLAK